MISLGYRRRVASAPLGVTTAPIEGWDHGSDTLE